MRGGARRSPAVRCLRDARACTTLISLLVICTSAHASDTQHAEETFALSIARQPLDGALQQLAPQCGVQMTFFSRVTDGLSAPVIEDDYTLDTGVSSKSRGVDAELSGELTPGWSIGAGLYL